MIRNKNAKATSHSKSFYETRYNKYLTRMNNLGKTPTIRDLDSFKDTYDEFQAKYIDDGKYASDLVGEIVSQDAYSLKYRTTQKIISFLTEEGEIEKIDELKDKSYQERIKFIRDTDYDELFGQRGANGKYINTGLIGNALNKMYNSLKIKPGDSDKTIQEKMEKLAELNKTYKTDYSSASEFISFYWFGSK